MGELQHLVFFGSEMNATAEELDRLAIDAEFRVFRIVERPAETAPGARGRN
jgi:hypothetical protein